MLRGLTLMALTALVAVGCTESPTEPAGQGEVAMPVTSYMNGPEQPGPTVY